LKRGDFEPALTDLDLALFEFVAKTYWLIAHPVNGKWQLGFKVSISSTFFARIFCTKVHSNPNFKQRKDFRTKNECKKR
jgi:hypothetical protein